MTHSIIHSSSSLNTHSNILLYGDSIMKGIVYNDKKKKYTVLSNAFANILAPKINGTIINAARFGNTLGRAIKRFYTDVTRKKPDIVLFEFGGNDCDFNWNEIAVDPDACHRPNTDFDEFQSLFEQMLKKLYIMDIEPVLLTLPPIDSKRYFTWVSKGDPKSARNILKWLGDVEQIHRWQAKYSQSLYQVAERNDTILIDIRKEFVKEGNYTHYLCSDGIHPNEEGHRIIALKIESYIKNTHPNMLKGSGTYQYMMS